MIPYLQLNRTTDGVIDADDTVMFDNVLSSMGNQISYDTITGEITLSEAGYYYFDWFVAPQFGLTSDGSNFAIVTSDNDPPLTGSSHVRVSPTIGFAIIEVTTPDKTIRLINTSDNSITLSQAVNVKAALAAFAIAGSDTSAEEDSDI